MHIGTEKWCHPIPPSFPGRDQNHLGQVSQICPGACAPTHIQMHIIHNQTGPKKAADIIRCPLADVLGGCGLLSIQAESLNGSWVGAQGVGRLLLRLWLALSFAPTHLPTFACPACLDMLDDD